MFFMLQHFFGHSYLADYGCFLMKNKSEMFDSYLLLAPESGMVPIFEKSDVADKRIYIAIGNQMPKGESSSPDIYRRL